MLRRVEVSRGSPGDVIVWRAPRVNSGLFVRCVSAGLQSHDARGCYIISPNLCYGLPWYAPADDALGQMRIEMLHSVMNNSIDY